MGFQEKYLHFYQQMYSLLRSYVYISVRWHLVSPRAFLWVLKITIGPKPIWSRSKNFVTLTCFMMIILVHLPSECSRIFFIIFHVPKMYRQRWRVMYQNYDLALLFISSIHPVFCKNFYNVTPGRCWPPVVRCKNSIYIIG